MLNPSINSGGGAGAGAPSDNQQPASSANPGDGNNTNQVPSSTNAARGEAGILRQSTSPIDTNIKRKKSVGFIVEENKANDDI